MFPENKGPWIRIWSSLLLKDNQGYDLKIVEKIHAASFN